MNYQYIKDTYAKNPITFEKESRNTFTWSGEMLP